MYNLLAHVLLRQDYKTYLDFVLAVENKQEPQALSFLFRILDVGGQGRLDKLTVRYFYSDMERCVREQGHMPPDFEDVLVEIFDMLSITDEAAYITLDDLIRW